MRINVYLPDDLAESYEASKGKFNVSAICQDAIRREMGVMALANDDEVVARLKQSRARFRDEECESGREFGARWAAIAAEWPHLLQLADRDVGPGGVDVTRWGIVGRNGQHVTRLTPSAPWDSGFVRGAVETFQRVRTAVVSD